MSDNLQETAMNEIEIMTDTPNGPIVEYDREQDLAEIESAVAPEWTVSWETTPVDVGLNRRRSPLIPAMPLRDAYLAAHAAAKAAEETWSNCECITCTAHVPVTDAEYIAGTTRTLAGDYATCPAWHVTTAADSARDAARIAWLVSDESRKWEFGTDGYWEVGHRCSPSEVEGELEEWIRDGDYERSGTLWIEAYAYPIDPATDQNDDDARVCVTVTLDPEEPACANGHEHDWQAPLEVVGGIAENPGVWGHGGGVKIHTVCAHCGWHQHVDTWAQNPSNGEQGLTSTSYEEPDEDSLAWIASLTADASEE